jgi:hypothetical protein
VRVGKGVLAMSIAARVLAGLLGVMFIGAASTKFAGLERFRPRFEHWRCPPWYRLFTRAEERIDGVLAGVGIGSPAVDLALAVVIRQPSGSRLSLEVE